MESVLFKIFSKKIDENVHEEFLKYGRGEYKYKYLIEAKRQKDKWVIKTSSEFANFFVRKCLEKSSGKLKFSGAIIGTLDIKADLGFEIGKIKQFMGVKQYIVNCEIDASNILALMNKYPRMFYALTFSNQEYSLKIKAKAPKSGKPGSKGEAGPKADFCSLATTDKAIIDDLFFDMPNFKEVKIHHSLIIDKVIFPQGVQDPVKLREMAKKKGKIIREIEWDGKKESKETEFEA